MPLLNLFLFLSIIPLFLNGADFHTPAPFVEIMERSFTKPWSPQAISSISDREHVLLLDDEEIKSMKDAITKETAAGEIDPDKESDNNNDWRILNFYYN